jgi:uncharacterized protein involved in outer membrane biogenesis
MKKLFIFLFCVVCVLASGLVLIPVFYDVNQRIRPLIISLIEKNGKAKAEVGRLSLSLWGQVQISIDGIKVIEKRTGDQVFSAGKASLDVPFMSLLKGEIDVTFRTDRPELFLAKDKARALNVMKLFQTESASVPEAKAEPKASDAVGGAALLGLSRARLSIDIRDATLTFLDRLNQSKTELKKILIQVERFQLAKPFRVVIATEADYESATIDLVGPIMLTSEVLVKDESFSEAEVKLTLDMSETRAQYTQLLKKEAGVPFKIKSTLSYKKPELKITEVKLWADDLNVTVSGYVRHEPEVFAKIDVKTESLELSKLHNVIDTLKKYSVAGGVRLDFTAEGPIDQLKYAGSMALNNVSGKKGQSDFSLSGGISDFSRPRLLARLSSRQIDLQDFSDYKNIRAKDLTGNISFQDGVLASKDLEFGLFGGRTNLDFTVDSNLKPSRYSSKIRAVGVDVNAATTSQMPEYKDSIKGKLESQMSLSGSLGTTLEIQKSMRGGGQLRLVDGSWSGLAAVKTLAEKIKSIPRLQEKAKDLKVGDSFKTLKTFFEIKDMSLFLTQLEMELKDSHTSLLGNGRVGFDKSFQFEGSVLAPLQSPPKSLRAQDGRAKLPIQMSGRVNGPDIKWEATTSAVANAYLQEEGAKAIESEFKKLKENIKDENLKKVLDKVPENVGDLLKGIKF